MPSAEVTPAVPDRQPDRTASVPVVRVERWIAGFSKRHAPVRTATTDAGWVLVGVGATAFIEAPGWLAPSAGLTTLAELPKMAAGLGIAVLVVRRAGYLVAVVRGPELVAGKVGARHIHGRTAAGGWSQKRYARRRANQGDEIAAAAAASLVALGPTAELDLLVLAGDRELRDQAYAQLPRDLRNLRLGPPLAIGTPTRDDLEGLPGRVTALAVSVWDLDS